MTFLLPRKFVENRCIKTCRLQQKQGIFFFAVFAYAHPDVFIGLLNYQFSHLTYDDDDGLIIV